MKKVINNLFTWKPVKVNPINLSIYPKRSKREVRLIDKKPFADSDKDKLMNWFDCKPLNRKKHTFLYKVKAKKGAGRYQPQVQRITDTLAKEKLQELEEMDIAGKKWGKRPEVLKRKLEQISRHGRGSAVGFFDFAAVPGIKLDREAFAKHGIALQQEFKGGLPMHLIIEDGVVKGEVVRGKKLGKGAREYKSMYILPEYRKQGISRKVMKTIFQEPGITKMIGVPIESSKAHWEHLGAKKEDSPEEEALLIEHQKDILESIPPEALMLEPKVVYESLQKDKPITITKEAFEESISGEEQPIKEKKSKEAKPEVLSSFGGESEYEEGD